MGFNYTVSVPLLLSYCGFSSLSLGVVYICWFFHPLADGTAAAAYNKAQKVARELLASKEAQEALFQAVRAKCAAGGVTNEESIEKILSMISSPDDEKLNDLIGYFATKEAKQASQTIV